MEANFEMVVFVTHKSNEIAARHSTTSRTGWTMMAKARRGTTTLALNRELRDYFALPTNELCGELSRDPSA